MASHNHKTAWDPQRPCTFVLWNKRLQTRYYVTGYSLHEFCDLMKFSYSEVVGTYCSNKVDPKGYWSYKKVIKMDARFHPASNPEKGV